MTTEQEAEVDKLSETEVEAVKPLSKAVGKSQSKAAIYFSQARLKLNPGLNYVLDGFPPVIAVIALIVAVFAVNESRSLRAQLISAIAKVESFNTNKTIPSKEDLDKVKASIEGIDKAKASTDDLDKVKAVMALEKAMREAEIIKQSEGVTKIIHSVSKLQVKMKISPTLEVQMREPVTVPKAAPVHEAATTPAAAVTSVHVPAPAKQLILSKPVAPAAAIPAPVKPVKKADVPAAKAPVATISADTKKQRDVQVKSIKEQIEEFNKK